MSVECIKVIIKKRQAVKMCYRNQIQSWYSRNILKLFHPSNIFLFLTIFSCDVILAAYHVEVLEFNFLTTVFVVWYSLSYTPARKWQKLISNNFMSRCHCFKVGETSPYIYISIVKDQMHTYYFYYHPVVVTWQRQYNNVFIV